MMVHKYAGIFHTFEDLPAYFIPIQFHLRYFPGHNCIVFLLHSNQVLALSPSLFIVTFELQSLYDKETRLCHANPLKLRVLYSGNCTKNLRAGNWKYRYSFAFIVAQVFLPIHLHLWHLLSSHDPPHAGNFLLPMNFEESSNRHLSPLSHLFIPNALLHILVCPPLFTMYNSIFRHIDCFLFLRQWSWPNPAHQQGCQNSKDRIDILMPAAKKI